MSKKIIKGTTKLSEAIRSRRQELGLTIEEAASRAGVGIKTWCRYEAGESIRQDKSKGVCKALNWHVLPGIEGSSDNMFDIEEYTSHSAWSEYINEIYGEAAAISFVIGSDILLPKGVHIGQLNISMMKDLLPSQFLMRYDYEFLYCLRAEVIKLRRKANGNMPLIAHSVLQELTLYLIIEKAEFLMECMSQDMEECGIEGVDIWKDWIFDLFDDMDIVTFLYADCFLPCDHTYHFEHWTEKQFICKNSRRIVL